MPWAVFEAFTFLNRVPILLKVDMNHWIMAVFSLVVRYMLINAILFNFRIKQKTSALFDCFYISDEFTQV